MECNANMYKVRVYAGKGHVSLERRRGRWIATAKARLFGKIGIDVVDLVGWVIRNRPEILSEARRDRA